MLPTNVGTPQGGVISPFLGNVALHGLESMLMDWVCTQPVPVKGMPNTKRAKQSAFAIIRYADDMVCTSYSETLLLEAKKVMGAWLKKTSGLRFNHEKTKLRKASEGFTFLGFTFITRVRGGKSVFYCYPCVLANVSIEPKKR